jgi:hypothetical protein
VLHIITVHYRSPQWIEIQTRHLREHIKVPYRTWTSLERIDPAYAVHFDRVFDQRGRHPGKLNHLAMEISHEGSDDDLLMFLDGDAFPIADPMPLIDDALRRAALVAVRRVENVNDPQPHPCFCVTTVGTWRSLPGDWSGGYTWKGEKGRRVTDVGGNLLRALELTDTPWVEVLRSNKQNPDPLFFGVYGDAVYHHGAGFRDGELSRAHLQLAPEPRAHPRVPVLRSLVRRLNWQRQRSWEDRTRRRYLEQSGVIFEKIQRGDSGWLADLI